MLVGERRPTATTQLGDVSVKSLNSSCREWEQEEDQRGAYWRQANTCDRTYWTGASSRGFYVTIYKSSSSSDVIVKLSRLTELMPMLLVACYLGDVIPRPMTSTGVVFLLVLITHVTTQLDPSPHGKFFISSSPTNLSRLPFRYRSSRLRIATVLSPVHTGDKVDCCRNRRQIGNKVDCRRYGRHPRQCVLGQSDTVDFVDFQRSRPCWIQLCRQCVPGFRNHWRN